MERLSTLLIALISVLSVWLTSYSVEGKCRGEWQSYHGCLGGNGKRSDPSLDPSPSDMGSSNSLEKILRKELGAYKMDNDDSEYVRVPEIRADSDAAYREHTLENFLRNMVARLSNKYNTK